MTTSCTRIQDESGARHDILLVTAVHLHRTTLDLMHSGFESIGTRVSLTAKELAKSVAWYRDVLGFQVLYASDSSAGVKAGNAFIYLNQDDGKRGWERVKGEGFALQFAVAGGVDDVANRIKAAGGKLESEPADMPWGQRMFRLLDPDGYRLSIAADLK